MNGGQGVKDKISISLFFSGIVIALCFGIVIGLRLNQYENNSDLELSSDNNEKMNHLINSPSDIIIHEQTSMPVLSKEDKITADTTYMILKKDLDNGEITKSETTIPEKYIGLSREQLLEQLKDFELNPPLTELENGFVSMELLAFSPQQVEVQMNYHYEKPTGIFYIMVYDHNIVVMLEDRKTVFLSTQIKLSELPQDIQEDVMRGLFIPNEKSLYDFLENYTS